MNNQQRHNELPSEVSAQPEAERNSPEKSGSSSAIAEFLKERRTWLHKHDDLYEKANKRRLEDLKALQ